MSESPQDPPPSPAPPPPAQAPAPPAPRAESAGHTPVQRVRPAAKPFRPAKPAQPADTGPREERRDFFNDAMRETLAPFAGLLERKINPILAALEALPDDVDRFTKVTLPSAGTALDQPRFGGTGGTTSPKSLPLDEAAGKPVQESPLRFLRPPGAAPQGQFESLCTACCKCAEVCPAHAIRIDFARSVAGRLPYIVAANQPCVVCDTLACMNQCPTGALKLVDYLKIKMGAARVNYALCVREDGEDCRRCLEACPITGEMAGPDGEPLFIHEATGRVRVRKIACVGCGLCESRCPTHPPAIIVDPYRSPFDPIVA